jgi:hypothetical protein
MKNARNPFSSMNFNKKQKINAAIKIPRGFVV